MIFYQRKFLMSLFLTFFHFLLVGGAALELSHVTNHHETVVTVLGDVVEALHGNTELETCAQLDPGLQCRIPIDHDTQELYDNDFILYNSECQFDNFEFTN